MLNKEEEQDAQKNPRNCDAEFEKFSLGFLEELGLQGLLQKEQESVEFPVI